MTRARTEQPGIVSLHSFSSGSYYDPDNISFGPIIGVDEHLVAAGAGFDWHAHRGVIIVSWVLDGTLRHEDSNGDERLVGPGALLVQATGDGVRHRETNASDVEPLRFVQTTILAESPPRVELVAPPATVSDGVMVDVVSEADPGGDRRFTLDLGAGDLLVVTIGEGPPRQGRSTLPDPSEG